MIDKVEEKLMKGCEKVLWHSTSTPVVWQLCEKNCLCDNCRISLDQHRATKKRVIELIEKLKFNTIHSGDEGTNCFIEVVRVDKLLEEISGEGK